jgi:geranylgeranyl pyrophosphate synthase
MMASELTKKLVKVELNQTRELIESELSTFISNFQFNLKPHLEYALSSRGKKLRPLIVLLSAQSVGGDRNKVLSLALAFELMHTATLVQDDIIDEDEFRRGIPALYKKWSINTAVLIGDVLIALTVHLSSKYGEHILKMISQTAIELSSGEYMDTLFSLSSATEENYFQMIEKKSASLFQGAASCGSLASGGSNLEVDCLSMFGKNFGIAYQLRDDLRDIKMANDSVPKDLKAGRITLPLIHLYQMSNATERKNLECIIEDLKMKNKIENVAFKKILKRLDEMRAIAYCEKKLDEYLQRAMTSLAPLKDSIYKNCLIQLVKSLKD